MNEGDFDKNISKKLKDEEANYPNLDANWLKVKEKLAILQDQKPSAGGVIVLPNTENSSAKRMKWLTPALLSALFLLLGTNGWLVWRLSNTTDSNIPLSSVNQDTRQTIRLYDTIIETKIIYKTDTVYEKVVVYQTNDAQPFNYSNLTNTNPTPSVIKAISTPIENKIGSEVALKPEIDINYPKQQTNLTETINQQTEKPNAVKTVDTTSSVLIQQLNHTTPTDSNQEKQTVNSLITNLQNTNDIDDSKQSPLILLTDSLDTKPKTPPIDSVHFAKVPYDSLEMKPTESIQKIIKTNPKKLAINHFSVGTQSGVSWTMPVKDGIDPSFWYGVTGEMAFKKRLRIGISLDNSLFYFKTNTRNPLLVVPADPPMTENYNLRYIEGVTSSIQAGIGFAYILNPKLRLKPLISAGYMRRWILPYEAEFEFTNKITGDHKSFDVVSSSIHKDNWLNMGIGMEFKVLRKLDARLKAEYIYDPNHGSIGLNQFLLRGGIYYKF